MTIAFFARVGSRAALDHVEFYRQDIELLRSLGHEVVTAIRWNELPRDADLYYIWWWTWAFQPLAVARRAGMPAIVTGVLDYPHPVRGKGFEGRPWWQRQVMKSSLARADMNVFISHWEAEAVPRRFRVRNPRYLPLAADTDFYAPSMGGREEFVFTVIWMDAYNVWRKCALEIVRTIPAFVRDHPSARFVIAGEKESGFSAVEAAVKELGVERFVEFPGIVSREEKRRLMQTCRVYLQPTRHEGFGAAILEAMSCGAVVVTNPAGAVPEVVGEAGCLIPDPGPDTICVALERLWTDVEARERIGRQARERAVEEFSVATRRAGLERLLAEILPGERREAESSPGRTDAIPGDLPES